MSTAILLAGLAFGDEAKGATVDYLCRQMPVDVIVRYCGGQQAAHNVVTPEGVHHVFAQFGSGMLASRTVKTHLSRFMLVEPLSMMREAQELAKKTPNPWPRTTVHRDAVIVTPFHGALNRVREWSRGADQHGSCGLGVGAAREMQLKFGEAVLMAKDLQYPQRVVEKLMASYDYVHEEISKVSPIQSRADLAHILSIAKAICAQYQHWPATLVDSLPPAETMLFEGAQGVLLDETHGTAPHNTWTNTTFGNADTLLDELGIADRLRIGCLRGYYTRHGAGPFPTEEPGLKPYLPEPHNSDAEFAGSFRVGRFDFNLARKALKIVGGVDYLAVSHLDLCPTLGVPERMFVDQVWKELSVPIGIYGRGPTAADRSMHPKLHDRLKKEVVCKTN